MKTIRLGKVFKSSRIAKLEEIEDSDRDCVNSLLFDQFLTSFLLNESCLVSLCIVYIIAEGENSCMRLQ